MTSLTCFTELNGFVLNVTYLTDSCLAVEADDSDFTGGKSDLCYAVLLSHKLSSNTSGANELSALTGIKLDVVNERTNGDISDRKCVSGLDISVSRRINYVSVCKTYRSDDVALVAVLVLEKCDVSCSVRVVLNADYSSCTFIGVSLEVDDSVLDLVSATLVSNGDSAVAVTAGVLLLYIYETLFRSKLGNVICLLDGVVGLYLIVGISQFLLSLVKAIKERDAL